MEQDTISIPEEFTLLPVPLPPRLAARVVHNGISRFFRLCYLGTKATWSTGWLSGRSSYYAAYQPLIEHPVMRLSLAGRKFGSDDYPLDSGEGRMKVYGLGGWAFFSPALFLCSSYSL